MDDHKDNHDLLPETEVCCDVSTLENRVMWEEGWAGYLEYKEGTWTISTKKKPKSVAGSINFWNVLSLVLHINTSLSYEEGSPITQLGQTDDELNKRSK